VPGDLPAALKQAIERQLEGVPRAALGRASARLSEQYRSGRSSAAALADRSDILSYLAARMPATYAANETVLAELCRRAPDFAPTSLLDIGAGSGAASWAAVETWPGIGAVTMLDAHRDFLDMAGKLVEGSGRPALTASERIIADLGDVAEKKRSATLVIASYALAEGATMPSRHSSPNSGRRRRAFLCLSSPAHPVASRASAWRARRFFPRARKS
jgi:ribosomal protein RSM22 (predicted rRNA methylase)